MRAQVTKWLAEVKPGEGVRVGLMVSCVFLIMTAYYALKVAREGLILAGGTFGLGGDELKTYATGAMALLLFVLVPLYDRLADHRRRIHVLNVSYAVVGVSLIAFWIIGHMGVPVGLAYFVWFGLISIFLVAQFWSYANDIYNEEQGTRLFAIIATGGSLGAIIGPRIAKLCSTFSLLLVATCLLFGAVVLINIIESRLDKKAQKRADKPIEGPGGFSLVMGDRSLFLIAIMLLVANLVNTTGEYILSNAVRDHAMQAHTTLRGQREIIKSVYSDLFVWMNALTFLIQLLFVSRIMDKLGARKALFILPVIALGAYASIALIGGYGVIRAAKIAENATDYSVQNTVRQALFLPASRAVKYKAKTVIDVFFMRLGDLIAAGLIGISIHTLHFNTSQLAMINIGLVVLWIGLAAMVARAEGKLTGADASLSGAFPRSAWIISLAGPEARRARPA